MISIHREGIRILIVTFLIFFGLSAIFVNFVPSPIGTILAVLVWILYGFIVWFFRNPERVTKAEPLDVIAPVDGKVVVIEKVFEKEFLQKEVIQVSIFMSPLNVHVCRYPVSGKVIYTKYHPGKYLVAYHPKSSELNERTTVAVECENQQKVLFRQIAGAVARRIVLYSKVGDNAEAGKEYGFIKFGSRLDVFLPLDAEILVNLNDKTFGGIDKIARLKEQ